MPMLKRPHPALTVALVAAMAITLYGCNGPAKGADMGGIKTTDGKMLHLQQVLERYDANGSAIPQYLELWLAGDKANCTELDKDGKTLSVSLDTGKSHIVYSAATNKAQKSDKSLVFTVNFANIKKVYPNIKTTNDGEYASRPCTFYLLDNGNATQWVKLYVDKATGTVLLCDAETFRLRTALVEERPLDDKLFTEPKGLSYEGGAGK
jgi:hypothetical protein